MAKRKRLTPPNTTVATESNRASLEAKSIPRYPMGTPPSITSNRAPIAQVAGDAATQAALDELAVELQSARVEGRLVQALSLDVVKIDHLIRDRIVMDAAEMDALKASIIARGQQTPIEVVDLGQGGYGLISGFRRLAALQALHRETGGDRFAQVQALIKPIETASDRYIAMVEENEIRSNLSFYERARLVAEAVRIGLYPTPAKATAKLFAHATPAKRSKIGSFVVLHDALGDLLRFPAEIPEKLGLALVSGLKAQGDFRARMRRALKAGSAKTAQQERAILERALRPTHAHSAFQKQKISPDITLEAREGRVVLSGKGITKELQKALTTWLRTL